MVTSRRAPPQETMVVHIPAISCAGIFNEKEGAPFASLLLAR
jgi:hypothetical protein